MRGVYIRKDSPFYWIRFYDKHESKAAKKRKSINTKIEVTRADRNRATKHEKLIGTYELRRRLEEFRRGLFERNAMAQASVKVNRTPLLSEAFMEYRRSKTIPGSPQELKRATLESYSYAVDQVVKACGDKAVHKYDESDYAKLLHHFESRNLSMNSRAIYTRSLRAVWNYFVAKKLAASNVIAAIASEKKEPDPIPLSDLSVIMDTLRLDERNPHHYHFVAFMMLTGCRPSSAVVQLKENVHLSENYITIENVKTSKARSDGMLIRVGAETDHESRVPPRVKSDGMLIRVGAE